MTSQRFSPSKRNRHDIKFSISALVVPMLYFAFILAKIVYEPIMALGSNDKMDFGFGSFKMKEITTCMLTSSGDDIGLALRLAISGFLFALASFIFANRRNAVNFFFSAPISRKDLFGNRAKFSILTASVGLAVAIAIDAVVNIVYLGNPMFIIKMALLLYLECLVYFVVSYAIFSIGICLTYTVVEGIFFGAGLYFLPLGLTVVLDGLSQGFLKGYGKSSVIWTLINGNDNYDFIGKSMLCQLANFNPLLFGKAIGSESITDSIIDYCYMVSFDGVKPEAVLPNINYIIPLMAWAIIGIVLMLAARYSFVHRKAEHTSLHASNRWANGFFSAEMALGAACLVGYGFDETEVNMGIRLLVAFVASAVAFLVVYSISVRKAVHKPKEYIAGVCVAVSVLLVAGIMAMGGLGYSTYVPDVEDIEMAAISGVGLDAKGNYDSDDVYSPVPTSTYGENIGMVMVTDPEDIGQFVTVADKMVNNNDSDANKQIRVVYQLKNGKRVYRLYENLNYSAQLEIMSLIDTKAYESEQRYLLTGEGKDIYADVEQYGFEATDFDRNYNNTSSIKIDMESAEKVHVDFITKGGVDIDNTLELRKAIADDYSATSYEQILRSEEPAYCMLNFEVTVYNYSDYMDEYADSSNYKFVVYPCMKNTVACIEKALAGKDVEDYDIVGAYAMSIGSAIDYYNSVAYYNAKRYMFYGGTVIDYSDEDMDSAYYNDFENPENVFASGIKVEDKAEIDELLSSAQPIRFVSTDDYAVLFVVNKGEKTLYIPMAVPQKNMMLFNNK